MIKDMLIKSDTSIEWYANDLSFNDLKKKVKPCLVIKEVNNLQLARKNNEEFLQKLQCSLLYKFIIEIKETYVDKYPGFVILSDLYNGIEEINSMNFCEVLSLCFGDLVSQHHESNTLIREVRNRGINMIDGGRYSDSNQGGSFHNDGSPYPLPLPDYNALFCVNQSPIGGELLILSIESVYKFLLRHHSYVLGILFQKFHFDRRGDLGPNGEVTVEKPIFYFEKGNICMTYLRDYIEAGQSYIGKPLRKEQIEALDVLDSVLTNKKFSICGKLKPGEMIIMNNKRTLHSRTAFEDDPKVPRLMLRIWMNSRQNFNK